MFEALAERAGRRAEAAADARRQALAEAAAAAVPKGVRVAQLDDGLCFEGRALRRRFALDASLRWLLQGLLR